LTEAQLRGEGVLGIQGDSGIGKTTIGRDVAAALGLSMYETSSAFRGFTVWALAQGVDCGDPEALAELAKAFSFAAVDGRIMVSGLDVTDDLRGPGAEQWVHSVAHVPAVRAAFVRAMHEWIAPRPVVIVGRHLREVFPEAQVIIEVERHDNATYEAAAGEGTHAGADTLAARSAKDRETGRRILANLEGLQVVPLDTTGMDKGQQARAVLEIARAHGF